MVNKHSFYARYARTRTSLQSKFASSVTPIYLYWEMFTTILIYNINRNWTNIESITIEQCTNTIQVVLNSRHNLFGKIASLGCRISQFLQRETSTTVAMIRFVNIFPSAAIVFGIVNNGVIGYNNKMLL